MTTIIVVSIVALVFLVAISVAVFMIWKQETQMRTDSLKGIEASLNEVILELSERHTDFASHQDIMMDKQSRRGGKLSGLIRNNKRHVAHVEDEDEVEVTVFKPSDIAVKNRKEKTPIKEEYIEEKPQKVEEKPEQPKADLKFLDIEDLFYSEGIVVEENEQDRDSEYFTGKSGRKYTAEELETLIKE